MANWRINKIIKSTRIIEEEVPYFCLDENNYYAVSSSGMILNFIQITSLQLPIEDEEEYFTHLWAQTLSGFFLFRQKVKDKIPQVWTLEREIIPEEEDGFFEVFEEEFVMQGYKIFDLI